MKTVGIIDSGSNSMRLSVVCFSESAFDIIYQGRMPVKLSENMNSDMLLKDEAAGRTISALKEAKKIFSEFGADYTVAVATAAVRKADNGKEFIEKVKDETGILINVIDGGKEAEYDFLAVKNSLGLSDCLAIDIGGASTELIGICSGELKNYISVPLASRNITEIYLSKESSETVLNAENKIYECFSKIEWLKDYDGLPIVGLGGSLWSINTSGCIRKEADNKIPLDSAAELYDKVKGMTVKERKRLVGENKGDVILGGLMVFMTVIKIASPSYLFISDKGVKDGIIYEIFEDIKNKA